MSKLIQGVGINDTGLPATSDGKKCPFYSRWTDMLKRCYSEAYHKQKPSYAGCIVCDDWLKLSNFKAWMECQDWEGNQLDKDLLVPGNKLYSPSTCCFVPNSVNQFVNEGGRDNGLPLGVTWVVDKGRYKAQVGVRGVSEYIGMFDTSDEASKAYLARKSELALEILKIPMDPRAAEAIRNRYLK